MPPRICLQCPNVAHTVMAIHSISFFIFFPITVKQWRQRRCTVKLSLLDKFPIDHTSALSISHLISVSEYKTILIFLLLWDKNGNDVIVKCPDVQSNILACALRRFLFFTCIPTKPGSQEQLLLETEDLFHIRSAWWNTNILKSLRAL